MSHSQFKLLKFVNDIDGFPAAFNQIDMAVKSTNAHFENQLNLFQETCLIKTLELSALI